MDQLSTYLEHISSAIPELRITTAKLHATDGQFNDVVVVNGDLIFRFPRSPHVAQDHAGQLALLAFLQDKLPLPIPNPLYSSGADAPWDRRFIGYRRLPGQPLFREALIRIRDSAGLQRMAKQLASFLRGLHRLPVAALPPGLSAGDSVEDWRALYAGIRETLFPHMRLDAQKWTIQYFEAYLTDPARYAFQPALRHGDYGGSNILYDPQSLHITGILDFQSAGLGDPATDAAALSTYGEAFFALCLGAYPEMESMRDRAEFYRGTFALQEAFYGLRDGDLAAFERGIAGYR